MKRVFIYLKKAFVSFLTIALISGCASSSKNIKSSYVSPLEYQSYNCEQVGQEMSRVGRRLSEVSGAQDKTATKDAVAMGVGMVLFWPSLFFLAAGDDRKEEIARLKGEAEAIEQCAINKQCTTVLARIEKVKKQLEEQKVDEALVEEKFQECVEVMGEDKCERNDIEAEIRMKNAKNKNAVAENKRQLDKESSLNSAPKDLLAMGEAEEKKVDEALVEEKFQECVEVMGEDKCERNDIEAETRMKNAVAENKRQLDKESSLNSEPKDLLAMGEAEDDTKKNHDIFKVKCSICGNVLTYKAKYSGSIAKCMQCDNNVELP